MSRFYVIATHGRSISAEGRAGRWGTSYAALDAAQCHAEVFSQYMGGRGATGATQGAPRRLRACEREAERRNALDAAGCPA